jgi:hypothetical protein
MSVIGIARSGLGGGENGYVAFHFSSSSGGTHFGGQFFIFFRRFLISLLVLLLLSWVGSLATDVFFLFHSSETGSVLSSDMTPRVGLGWLSTGGNL